MIKFLLSTFISLVPSLMIFLGIAHNYLLSRPQPLTLSATTYSVKAPSHVRADTPSAQWRDPTLTESLLVWDVFTPPIIQILPDNNTLLIKHPLQEDAEKKFGMIAEAITLPIYRYQLEGWVESNPETRLFLIYDREQEKIIYLKEGIPQDNNQLHITKTTKNNQTFYITVWDPTLKMTVDLTPYQEALSPAFSLVCIDPNNEKIILTQENKKVDAGNSTYELSRIDLNRKLVTLKKTNNNHEVTEVSFFNLCINETS